MMSKFVGSNRDQRFLLPPGLRDWIPEDDLAHFVLEAVERVGMERFKVNERGTADNGYANGDEIETLSGRDIEALVATGAQGGKRQYDFRPPKAEKPPKEPKAEWLIAMKAKLESDEGRKKYRLRKQTVEPVFGIIKNVLNFRRFSLRGLAKVQGEWELLALAYNCKRLHRLQGALAG